MGRMRYSAGVSFEDYLIFSHDELDIERELLEMMAAGAEASPLVLAEYRAALRRVDQLKLAGSYEDARKEIGASIGDARDAAVEGFIERNPAIAAYLAGDPWAVDNVNHVSNLFAGLRSPDPEQRVRFRKMYEEMKIAEKSPSDVKYLLPVLERAKRRKGRPSLRTPWENEQGNMERIRQLVASGKSVLSAAKEIAASAGVAGVEERAKTLAKLYRDKQAVRN